ncbi:EP300-interacting inhibitor of differentiation 3 [Anopheles cruzii]|uniref:EP300-interacting inhibitor of differentiation 3 n=1 Tax=Anopheles cruzii TaxID=68878 RepID=UPI0022EC767C|nr:EP300-interacting inhibitor of differentiation 3 [Anopheles cruzii]
MDAEARKKRYQELMDQGHDLALRTQIDNAVDIFQGVSSILMQTNKVMMQGIQSDTAENATEVCINVQIVKMSHDLVGAALQRSENSQFCDEELTTAIMALVGNAEGQKGWDAFGKAGITAFRMSKHSPCLYGTFEHLPPAPVEKPVKERRRRQRQELGEARKPEIVKRLNQEEADARKLQDVMEQLKSICVERGTSVPYFELITDPTDYMSTVDNAFRISFLIRDGAVVLEMVNGVLCARPTSEGEKRSSNDDNVQAMLSFNCAQWKDSIKRFRLQRPLLSVDREIVERSQQ